MGFERRGGAVRGLPARVWTRAAACLGLVSAGLLLAACAATTLATTFDGPTRTRVYNQYWNQLEREYPFFGLAGVNPGAHREAYRDRVVGAHDRIGYLHALAGMFGELRDPHIKIIVDDSWYRPIGSPIARPRIGTMYVDRERYLVSWQSSMNVRPRVRPGARFGYPRVVSIEGYPADFSNIETLLVGEAGTEAEIVLAWWDGSRETVHATRNLQVFNPMTRPRGSASVRVESAETAVRRGRAVESVDLGEVTWLWLRTLSPASANASREALLLAINKRIDRALDDRALVIDLTGNGGGDPLVLRGVLARFMREGTLVWLGEGPGGYSFRTVIEPEDRAGRAIYSRPVVIVTDRYTASAAEHLAAVLQREHRARVVGAQTVGAEAMVKPIKIEQGLSVEVGLYRLTDAAGRGIQSVGVTPDVDLGVTLGAMERLGANRARREARLARLGAALDAIDAGGSYDRLVEKLGEVGYPDLR